MSGKDQEMSYVYYMKYANLHYHLMKLSDKLPPKDQNYVKLMMSLTTLKKAINAMEELKPKLLTRYKALEPVKKVVERPVTPKNKVIPKIVSESLNDVIDPNQLFKLIKEKCTTFLILDARPQADYRATRISIPHSINVPEEILEPATTCSKILRGLNVEDKSQFGRRNTVDVLILMDWLSEAFEDSQHLMTLRDALTKWDTNVNYRSQLHLLKGGLENFSMHYPTYVTDAAKVRSHPRAQRVKTSKIAFNRAELDKLQYPDLDRKEDLNAAFVASPSPQSSPVPNGSFASDNNNSNTTTTSTTSSMYPSSSELSDLNKAFISGAITLSKEGSPKRLPRVPDRATKPMTSADNVKLLLGKDLQPEASSTPVPPKVDRSLKAKLLLDAQSDNEKGEIKQVIEAESDLVEESLELENRQLELENRWEWLRLRREKEAEEEMKNEVLKKEEQLLDEIKKLGDEKKTKDMENEDLRKQLQSMKIKLETESAKRHQYEDEKKAKELLKIKEQERERLKEEVNLKRIERMRRQELEERKRKLQESERKRLEVERQLAEKERANMDSISKLKLKDDSFSSGALNRSHSSPNIAKMMDGEDLHMPKFCRGKKPAQQAWTERPDNSVWQKAMARYRDFQPVLGTGRVCLTGLKNLGNTCYMNSVLQCLSNFNMPSRYFLNRQILCRDLNPTSSTKGNIAIEYAEVLRNLRSGQYNSIVPSDFKSIIGRYNSSFRSFDQQDAHEFLNNLIVWLHNDLNEMRGTENAKLPEQKNEGIPEIQAAQNALQMEKEVDKSFIRETFYGQWRSILTCPCGWTSVKYEPFFELALQLPPGNGKCTLWQCIEGFLNPENVNYKCPKCNKNRECTKRFEIVRLPSIIIIQLVRFYNDGLSRKRQNYVDFDMNNLDLGQYVTACGGKLNDYKKYNLYAVCNHVGCMEGGHYTAYCNVDELQRWHKYDDHEVYEMDARDVKSSKAYILFYSSLR